MGKPQLTHIFFLLDKGFTPRQIIKYGGYSEQTIYRINIKYKRVVKPNIDKDLKKMYAGIVREESEKNER